jgi:hypothetical protein
VATLAEAAEALDRDVHQIAGDGDEGRLRGVEKQNQVADALVAAAGLHDDGCLEKRSGREARLRIGGEPVQHEGRLGCAGQGRDERGRVDDHRRGSPASSYPMISSGARSSRTGSRAQCSAIRPRISLASAAGRHRAVASRNATSPVPVMVAGQLGQLARQAVHASGLQVEGHASSSKGRVHPILHLLPRCRSSRPSEGRSPRLDEPPLNHRSRLRRAHRSSRPSVPGDGSSDRAFGRGPSWPGTLDSNRYNVVTS